MEAAAIPFPSDETTPPVTKINLAINSHPLYSRSFKKLRNPLEIFRGVHAQRLVLGFCYTNGVAVFERAKLLQALRLLERAYRQGWILEQKVAAIDVEADVLEVHRGR